MTRLRRIVLLFISIAIIIGVVTAINDYHHHTLLASETSLKTTQKLRKPHDLTFNSKKATSDKSQSTAATPTNKTTVSTSGNCTKTTSTKNVKSSSGATTYETSTSVNCKGDGQNSSTSVNVNSNSNQSTSTGSNSAGSGSATTNNVDNTNLEITQ
jgi:hypothetical protein